MKLAKFSPGENFSVYGIMIVDYRLSKRLHVFFVLCLCRVMCFLIRPLEFALFPKPLSFNIVLLIYQSVLIALVQRCLKKVRTFTIKELAHTVKAFHMHTN